MPIILDDLAATAKQAKASGVSAEVKPVYFSSTLTGSGKKSGLLNENLVPVKDAQHVKTQPVPCYDKKATITTGNAKYELIPMNFYESTIEYIPNMPATAVNVSLATPPNGTTPHVIVQMKNIVVEIEETGSGNHRKVYPIYQILFFSEAPAITLPDHTGMTYCCNIYTEPCLNVDQFISQDPDIDKDKLTEYFNKLRIYDCIVNSAIVWKEHVPEVIKTDIFNNGGAHVVDICRKLNNYPANNSYPVDLQQYSTIYDIIEKYRPELLPEATAVNLRLLLNKALRDLAANKPSIPTFTPGQWVTPQGVHQPSPEQMAAITTTEPCCIIQSGAGSGKSSTIHNRLRFMELSGVDMSKVMVLSFTNAAANHIKKLAPNVNSKTIASMIHDIYANNYSHELSSVDTMLNVLYAKKEILNNPDLEYTMKALIDALQTLKRDINNGFIEISQVIQDDFNGVIAILNMIGQTILELESIICYYADAALTEPILDCDHLIMDEVQDNSIFEFIYIIRYIIRHKATLYLVGDCSQTLYEFRASDPRALNALEMSGVFHCMKLQTNYRSNQNILDFANVGLANIEANQYAQIQLHANCLTSRDFKEDVTVEYRQLQNKSDALKDALPSMFIMAKNWIKDKLDKGQQVCFLCYKRKYLEDFEDAMGLLFPQANLINIVPAKTHSLSYFSKYIYALGEDYTHKNGSDATMEITRHVVDNIEQLVRYDSQKDALKNHLEKWRASYQIQLGGADVRLQQGLISHDQFKAEVFDTMISYEIAQNAMKQHLTSMSNEKLKSVDTSGFNFICSTIHSAKGLEFDNVILLYDESEKRKEDSKRMYYVGLTRAKEAEYVMAYNTTKGSDILSLWEMMANPKPQAATPDEEAVNDSVVVIDQTQQTSQQANPKAYVKKKSTNANTHVNPQSCTDLAVRKPTPLTAHKPAGLKPAGLRPAKRTVQTSVSHKAPCFKVTKTAKPGRKPGSKKR